MAMIPLRRVLLEVLDNPVAFRERRRNPWLITWKDVVKAPDYFDDTLSPPPDHPEAPAEPSAWEVVRLPGLSVQEKGVSAGRIPECDVCLPDSQVSRIHAYFRRSPDGTWTLVDAGSTNGTFVGGVRLDPSKPFVLPERAVISFGHFRARFFSADAFVEYMLVL